MIDSDAFSPRRTLSLLLVMLLLPWHLPAQGRNKTATTSFGLKIYILEGNGAVNFIPNKDATTPVVEVRDSNDLPVSGATVEFHLPETGPGGDFPNGQHTLTAITTLAGQAQAPFTVRPQPGTFEIQVSAKIDTRSATTVIAETNSLKINEATTTAAPKKHRWYTSWKFLVPVSAGVVVLVVLLATRGGGGSGSGPTIGLTPGVPTYGAPH
jgi:hypothetical protein